MDAFGHTGWPPLFCYLLHFGHFGVWATCIGTVVGPDGRPRAPKGLFLEEGTSLHTYPHIYTHIDTHMLPHIHTHTHRHIHPHTDTYTHTLIYTHIYTHIHTQTHTYTHLQRYTHKEEDAARGKGRYSTVAGKPEQGGRTSRRGYRFWLDVNAKCGLA